MSIITISRQFGSGGDQIAYQLCQELGYRFFDKLVLDEAAQAAGMDPEEIYDYSEDNYKVRGFLDRLFGNSPVLPYPGIWPDDLIAMYEMQDLRLREEESIHFVQAAIQYAYRLGNMVIVGRGGQLLLKDRPDVFHVRIVAPLEIRIDRVKAQLGQNELNQSSDLQRGIDDRAKYMVEQRDAASSDYIKRFYHANWSDPLLYHLVINTAHLNTVQAVKAIIDLLPVQENHNHVVSAMH